MVTRTVTTDIEVTGRRHGHHRLGALQTAGADLPDVAKTTVYVASQRRADLLAAWKVVRRHFGGHDAPSTLLGVAVLDYRDQLVEAEAVTALG